MMKSKKRGPATSNGKAERLEIERLRREVERLKKRLETADVIDVQRELSETLQRIQRR